MSRIAFIILLLLMACVSCFGQSTYKGLTPGKSTRADVERVFGPPAKSVSKTLAEYKAPEDIWKLYIQYSYESPAASVERIELMCEHATGANQTGGCEKLLRQLVKDPAEKKDAYITGDRTGKVWGNHIIYYGPPFFIVETFLDKLPTSAQWRLGLYSRELYENAVPKSCTGVSFRGAWETNRGRMTLTETAEGSGPTSVNIRGAYSTNNGSIWGHQWSDTLNGGWKDDTGAGTMQLDFPSGGGPYSTFTGTWERTSGKGPKQGTWEGRCVETKTGGNN